MLDAVFAGLTPPSAASKPTTVGSSSEGSGWMRGVMVMVLGFRARSAAIGWALVSVLGVLAWATPARADGDESADKLLRRGIELRKAGKDEEALEAFRAAYSSRP